MGLYYNSFLNSLMKVFNKEDSLEDFLLSEQAKKVYNEYDVPLKSFQWSLNILEFSERVGKDKEESQLLDYARKVLNENSEDWIN